MKRPLHFRAGELLSHPGGTQSGMALLFQVSWLGAFGTTRRNGVIRHCLFLCFALLGIPGPDAPAENRPLEKSAYFAYVDRDYIFTIEVVDPGVPLLNFVSMTDADISLSAKNIRLALENRKVAGRLLAIEAGNFQKPMVVPSLTIHPRSSFGVRIDGDFGDVKELFGATIQLGNEDFKLVPLRSLDFESLVLKVNRINLGSPDFHDDWRVLRLELLGSRSPAARRQTL